MSGCGGRLRDPCPVTNVITHRRYMGLGLLMLIKTYRIPKALIKEEVTDEQHRRGDRKLEDSSHRSIKSDAAKFKCAS